MGHAPPKRGSFVLVGPRVTLTHEDLGLSYLREEYAEGRIDVEEFERGVERVLRGDLSVIPMGGMPPPDTGQREMR